MHPIPASRNRPPATTVAGLAAAALVSAVIPAAAALAFLISLAARRPLVAVAAGRGPRRAGRPWPSKPSWPPSPSPGCTTARPFGRQVAVKVDHHRP